MDFAGAYTWPYIRFLLEGFMLTLQVAGVAILLSFVVGIILGTIRYTKFPVISQIVAVVVDTIRNLPLFLIILVSYLILPQFGINMSVFWAAVFGLTIFEGCMIAEILRGGLNSIDKGQIEAARSSGLSYFQTLRLITLPQALRRMVPPLLSQTISLLKDTSLAVAISLPELMNHVRIVGGQNPDFYLPMIVFAAMLYFIVNYSLSLFARRLETRVDA
ncbi:amino acid ABC transporter permease [Paenibacillus shunpengii]|uniref:Amino acid ABC transporter permease n=1 Tax=Paenibacillus shunpengii TaxID=2054424 RepID=A0ABW5SR27_9BACL|nr:MULTISPECIES: amino acid ABC transporter permease [unclassified Paenibacillus]OMC65588.1 glutamine ABC transporter permease [Paenibacillus sp. FSL H7-0326]SDX23201.1 amino acid ABC transporter membrane protein 2, PAAT family [Paenibacillus sp. PDC88]